MKKIYLFTYLLLSLKSFAIESSRQMIFEDLNLNEENDELNFILNLIELNKYNFKEIKEDFRTESGIKIPLEPSSSLKYTKKNDLNSYILIELFKNGKKFSLIQIRKFENKKLTGCYLWKMEDEWKSKEHRNKTNNEEQR